MTNLLGLLVHSIKTQGCTFLASILVHGDYTSAPGECILVQRFAHTIGVWHMVIEI